MPVFATGERVVRPAAARARCASGRSRQLGELDPSVTALPEPARLPGGARAGAERRAHAARPRSARRSLEAAPKASRGEPASASEKGVSAVHALLAGRHPERLHAVRLAAGRRTATRSWRSPTSSMPRFDLVVATQDWHPADHGSFASNHPGTRPATSSTSAASSRCCGPTTASRTRRARRSTRRSTSPASTTSSARGPTRRSTRTARSSTTGTCKATGLDDFLRARGVDAIVVLRARDRLLREVHGARRARARLRRDGRRGRRAGPSTWRRATASARSRRCARPAATSSEARSCGCRSRSCGCCF